MKIGKEIKQGHFESEYMKASINLMFTANWLTARQKEFFSQFDITTQQFNILRILKGQYPNAISTSGIKERMIDRSPDTSRIVERMYKKGWVEKEVCPSDKRLVDIKLSPDGMKVLEKINPKMDKLHTLMQGLSEKEATKLNELLDKLRG